MRPIVTLVAIAALAFVLAACDSAVGLPVADASPARVMPRLHPALAADAADANVFEYSQ